MTTNEASSDKKTILVVDDEIDMRLFLSTVAQTSGYHAVLARNGEEGLKKVRHQRPDLILLDIMMPKEGGVHMYGKLKMDPALRDIPVIILSAVSRKTFFHYLKMLSIRMGDMVSEPDAYLEKPPEADDVIAAIESILK
jgi:two-component system phosphate regulon response regulator PhoB